MNGRSPFSANGRIPAARIETIWFDLDATLYPADNGLWAMIGARIEAYLENVMKFSPDRIRAIKQDYYLRYGTTLRGLQENDHVDTQDYLDFVHDIPVGDYLEPDPALREMILALPQHRWVFSNSDRPHVTRVLEALDIADCFAGLITIESIGFQCKPSPEAFEAAFELSGVTDPASILFLEDSVRNLQAAGKFGIHTVLVGPGPAVPGIDLLIASPHDLPAALPELFTNPWKQKSSSH